MAHVVIVGAGVIGLLTAYELIRAGEQVTIIDKGEPGQACSAGNAGWVCPSLAGPLASPGLTWTSLRWMLQPESPLAIAPRALPSLAKFLWTFWRHCNESDYAAGLAAVSRLGMNTMDRFDALVEDGLRFEMHSAGLLFAFADPKTLAAEVEEIRRVVPYGYAEPEPLDASAVHALEPILSDEIIGGLLIDRERHVDPESLTRAVAQRVRELGGKVVTNAEVRAVTRSGSRAVSVSTSTGVIEADRFVIAAGAWSGKIAEQFGSKLPIHAAKGYSITVSLPSVAPRHPLYFAEAKVACTPMNGSIRFAGTLELSGINEELNTRRVGAIRKAARRYLVQPPHGWAEREWVGMRPIAPDALPVIGQLPGVSNAYIATGHGMLGVTLAPSTGLALSELITTGRSTVDLRPFDPARFSR